MKSSSFLPQDYVDRRAQRRSDLLSLFLFVVVMGGIISAFIVTDRDRKGVEELQAQVNEQYAQAAQRLQQLQELQEKKAQMIHKAHLTGSLIERVPRTLILAEVVNSMPTSLSLLDLALNSKVVKDRPVATTALDKAKLAKNAPAAGAPPVPQVEVSVQILGVAPTDSDVAQFMTALGNSPMFTDINLGYSQEVTMNQQTLRKFQVDMLLVSGLDMKTLDPQRENVRLTQNPMGSQFQIDQHGRLIVPEPPPARATGVVQVSD